MQKLQEMWVRSLGQEDPLEKEMANQSSILAWRIPWLEEPGRLRLQSLGSQESQTLQSDCAGRHTAIVSVTHSQPQSENSNWKIPKLSNS